MPQGIIMNTNNYCVGLGDELSSIPPGCLGRRAHVCFTLLSPALSVSGPRGGKRRVPAGILPTFPFFSCTMGLIRLPSVLAVQAST